MFWARKKITDGAALPLPTTIRFEVLRRDRYRCVYCGTDASRDRIEVDHVIPRSRGGTDRMDNLVAACQRCNGGKSDRPDPTTCASAMERAVTSICRRLRVSGNTDQRESIRKFVHLLPITDLYVAADIAKRRHRWFSKNRFRYFCGINWRKIRGERHENEF